MKMQVLNLIVAPLILFLLLGIAYAFVMGGSELGIVKKLIRWVIIFVVFCIMAKMFIPHG
jgi:hypothetical protein